MLKEMWDWIVLSGKPSTRLLIIIFLAIVILFITFFLNLESHTDDPNAIIGVDSEIIRLGDDLEFDASDSTGEIIKYEWDFGDGVSSNLISPIHRYETAGWYNVTLNVSTSDKTTDNDMIVIGVQVDDQQNNQNIPARRHFGSGRMGTSVSLEIGPNIGNPTINVQFHLEGVVGKIGFTLWLINEGAPEELHQDSFTVTGGTFDHTYSSPSTSIPDEVMTLNTDLIVHVWIDEGKWDGGTLETTTIFPVD